MNNWRMIPEDSRRQMWRLAILLAGDPERAFVVLRSALLDGRNPAALDRAHLDRLMIQHARRVLGNDATRQAPSRHPDPGVHLLQTLHELSRQSMEAWLLTRVEGRQDVEVARAMDCSKTAAGRFLASADEFLRTRIEDPNPAIARLHELLARLDADAAFEEAAATIEQMTRRRFADRWLPALTALLFLIYTGLQLL